MSGRAIGRRPVATGGIAMLVLTGAAAESAEYSTDDRLLALGHAVIRAADREARACLALDRADAARKCELDAAVDEAFAAWSDRVRAVATVPAFGAVGLAVKAALILEGFHNGRTEATEVLAKSLRDDIARIAPSIVGLTA
jgi:hypothetical protein